ncbi:MAG: radical SAM protein, partial [Nanoarchaeota archaeon]|nr:radical SAM protein [Nanoarchaeota archaeon]
MNRVLLLNPPAKNNLQRDFLCSSSSKADYYWPPIDLIVLSGLLKEFEVRVIDAVASKISNRETLSKIKAMNPDSIICLVSSIGFNEEMSFLKNVKDSLQNSRIILIGDIAFFEKEKVIKNKFVDAILLDFTSHQIIEYLKNPENKKIKDICYKLGSAVVFNGVLKSSEFSYGMANLELFNLNSYSIPYSIHKKIAPILFNYGCPYKCSFCASGNIGYKIRNLSESKQEIMHLYKKGFKEIFIRDFNFTTNKAFVMDICTFIIKNNIKISWSCEGRVDNVDRESLQLMKKAGCYLIFFGVESGK